MPKGFGSYRDAVRRLKRKVAKKKPAGVKTGVQKPPKYKGAPLPPKKSSTPVSPSEVKKAELHKTRIEKMGKRGRGPMKMPEYQSSFNPKGRYKAGK